MNLESGKREGERRPYDPSEWRDVLPRDGVTGEERYSSTGPEATDSGLFSGTEDMPDRVEEVCEPVKSVRSCAERDLPCPPTERNT